MSKHKKGSKIRQAGFVVDKPKKHAHKAQKAPWSDPLKKISRGGFGR